MKSIGLLRRKAALLLIGALLFVQTGCLGETAASGPVSIRIGVTAYLQDDTFISTMLQNLEEMAKKRELIDGVQITLNVVDGRGSQSIQNEQVDRFLSAGYDAICVNIVDRTAAAVIIDKAKNVDIPVIFFNREPVEEDMMRWDKVYYVGAEAGKSGVLQGELVVDAYQDDPKSIDRNGDGILQYVMLEGEPGHQDALLRTEYSVKMLSAANIVTEKLANDTANWNRGQAASKMSQWIEQFGGAIEVVFSNNDDMALGAIDACRTAELASLPFIVGIDATPPALAAVRDGSLRGTVFNDSAGQSQAVLDIALALAQGRDPAQAVDFKDDKYVWLPYTKVTAENMDQIAPEEKK